MVVTRRAFESSKEHGFERAISGLLLQSADPIPQWSKIFVVERRQPNVFIKIDGMPQPNFRFLHAPRGTSVARDVESDRGILWMQRTRFKKHARRLHDILRASNFICQLDPRAWIFRVHFHKMSGDRGGHVPFLGRQVDIDSGVENRITGLVLRLDLFESLGGIFKHSQFTIPTGGKHLLLPTSFQGIGDSCRKTKRAVTASIKSERK